MIKDLIALDPSSKVWIYPSDQFLSYEQLEEVREKLFHHLDQWQSHGQSLVNYGNIFHRKFIAIFVDETSKGASGCSIDSNVHFLQDLGKQYGVDFFDRTQICCLIDEEIEVFENGLAFKEAIKQGKVNNTTLVFDHSVLTKDDFLKRWIRPVEETWLKRYL